MLRASILNFGGSWSKYLSLLEFAYNNSYQSTIGMPLFEALCGQRYRFTFCWEEVSERKIFGSELIQETAEKIKIIKMRMKVAQSR